MSYNEKRKTLFVATLQAAVIVWLFLLTVKPVEIWWPEAEVWLIRAIPVTMVLGTVACLVMRSRMRFRREDCLVGVWWAVEAVRCYAGNGVFTPTAFIAFSETVFLYFALRLLFEARPSEDDRLILVCIMAGCIYEAAAGLQQLIDGTSRHSLFPVTGSMLNPGPYSAYLAIGLSAALVFVKNMRGVFFEIRAILAGVLWVCRLAMITVAVSLFMLPSTWSRAAMVAAGTAALLLYRDELRRWRYRYVPAVVVVAVLAGAYLLKAGSADGRMLMWLVSLSAFCEAPLFGAGIGGFSGAYASGMENITFMASVPGQFPWLVSLIRSANVTDNAFCEPITIGVEQGCVGALFFLNLICMVFVRLHMCSRSLKYGLLALVVFSLFSYPLHVVPYRIIFAVICAWAVSNGRPRYQYMGRLRRRACMAAWCVAVAVALPAGMLMRAEAESRAAAAADYRMLSGVDAACVTDDYYELLPLMDDNADFLFAFGKALHGAGRHNDSNAVLLRGMQVSADPMFRVLAGRNYEAMGMPSEAAHFYWKAFRMMPNRVYPLYRLMLLHKEQEQWEECRKVAERIVLLEEKVTSQATEEMKREAWSFLGSPLGLDDYMLRRYEWNRRRGEPSFRKLRGDVGM